MIWVLGLIGACKVMMVMMAFGHLRGYEGDESIKKARSGRMRKPVVMDELALVLLVLGAIFFGFLLGMWRGAAVTLDVLCAPRTAVVAPAEAEVLDGE